MTDRLYFFLVPTGHGVSVHDYHREDHLRVVRGAGHQLRLQLHHLHAQGQQVQAGALKEDISALSQGARAAFRLAKVRTHVIK